MPTLTDHETLFNAVTHARLVELIKDPAVQVLSVDASENAYGEFLFVEVSGIDDMKTVVFYGLGQHERSGRWQLDDWCFYEGGMHSGEEAMDKEYALALILVRRTQLVSAAAKNPVRQTAKERMYDEVAAIVDEEDAALLWDEGAFDDYDDYDE